MNPKLLLAIALTLGLQASNPPAAFAAGKPPGKVPPKKEPTQALHTTISSVSAESISVTNSKTSGTYKITKDTQIELKGQKAKVEELKTGMRVTVTQGSDPTTAARITANDAPKDAPKDADKKK